MASEGRFSSSSRSDARESPASSIEPLASSLPAVAGTLIDTPMKN